MSPVTTKVFRDGGSQVVRIPAELSFDTDTVTMEKQGDALVVRPRYSGGWKHFFDDESLVLPGDFEPGEDPPLQPLC